MVIGAYLASIWLLIGLVAAEISFPAEIEVDILWPIGAVDGKVFTNGIDAIFGLQNAEAAYGFEWEIWWRISNISYWNHWEMNPQEFHMPERTGFPRRTRGHDFRYSYNDGGVTLLPVADLTVKPTALAPGEYVLSWEYYVKHCSSKADFLMSSGSHHFSVVEEGGNGLDVLLTECPTYAGGWTVESAKRDNCPSQLTSGVKTPNPCAARLQTQGQVDCLAGFSANMFAAVRNETEACTASFERVDWPGFTDSYKLFRNKGDEFALLKGALLQGSDRKKVRDVFEAIDLIDGLHEANEKGASRSTVVGYVLASLVTFRLIMYYRA